MNRPLEKRETALSPGIIGKPVAACGRFVKRPYEGPYEGPFEATYYI